MSLWVVAALVHGADRFSYSLDGSEVTDSTTGLVWRRCPEGMAWRGGTCADSATTFTHEGALQRAQAQTGWRLPNVKELSSIVDDSKINPAIYMDAFPSTPFTLSNSDSWFWTSTPRLDDPRQVWGVSFSYGKADSYARNTSGYVRLVR